MPHMLRLKATCQPWEAAVTGADQTVAWEVVGQVVIIVTSADDEDDIGTGPPGIDSAGGERGRPPAISGRVHGFHGRILSVGIAKLEPVSMGIET